MRCNYTQLQLTPAKSKTENGMSKQPIVTSAWRNEEIGTTQKEAFPIKEGFQNTRMRAYVDESAQKGLLLLLCVPAHSRICQEPGRRQLSTRQ